MLTDCLWEHAGQAGTVALVDEFESLVESKGALHDPIGDAMTLAGRTLSADDDRLPVRMPSGVADDGGCRLYPSAMCETKAARENESPWVDPAHTLVLLQRDVATNGGGLVPQAFTAESVHDFHRWGASGSVLDVFASALAIAVAGEPSWPPSARPCLSHTRPHTVYPPRSVRDCCRGGGHGGGRHPQLLPIPH